MQRQLQTQTALVALALGVAFFLLYALTAAPSIVELYDDSLEFQVVGPTLGIAHPTGYPLYTLLGGLWSRVLFPFGNWAWRMNLLSALAGAWTVALLFLLTQRVAQALRPSQAAERQRLSPGLFAAIAFGLSPIWWAQATVAEVYTLHNFFVGSIVLLTVRLVMRERDARENTARFTVIALLFGLGLAHHRTIVLLVPGVALMLWGERWLWRPSSQWLRWSAALLLPLLLYLYLPLRAAMGVGDLNGSYVNSWTGFWEHLLAVGYTGFFQESTLTDRLSPAVLLTLWREQFGIIGVGLGLLGLGWGLWQRRAARIWFGLLIILLTNLAFALIYRVGDPEVFLLPALLLFALMLGVGVAAVRDLLTSESGTAVATRAAPAEPRRRLTVRAVQTLLFFLLLTTIDGKGRPIDRSQEWAIHDYAVALAKVNFPAASRVIGLEGQITALRYMQAAEGLGLQATGVVANDPTERAAAIATAVAAGNPTYITQEVAGIADLYSFSGAGPLVRVWPRGKAAIERPQHALQADFAEDQLVLVGHELTWLAEAGGPTLQVILYWQPRAKLAATYKLSLRLLDDQATLARWPNGDPVSADRFPLRQVSPTNQWRPNEIVRDVHYLRVPAEFAAATSTSARTSAAAVTGGPALQIILYDANSITEAGRVMLPIEPWHPAASP